MVSGEELGPATTPSPGSSSDPLSPGPGSDRNVHRRGVHGYRPAPGGDHQSNHDQNQSGSAGQEEKESEDVIPPPDEVSGVGNVVIFLVLLMIGTTGIILCFATQCRMMSALINFVRARCG